MEITQEDLDKADELYQALKAACEGKKVGPIVFSTCPIGLWGDGSGSALYALACVFHISILDAWSVVWGFDGIAEPPRGEDRFYAVGQRLRRELLGGIHGA